MAIRVKAEFLHTTNQLKALTKSLNKLEQYLTQDCLEVWGIPKSSSDTREDMNEIVVELSQKIRVDLKKEYILTSHHLPSKGK